MKNFLFLIPIFIFLLTGCSLNNKDSEIDIFILKEKCKKYTEEYIEWAEERNWPSIVLLEKFGYNQKLNTCLAYFIVRERQVGTTYNIINLLNNEIIFYNLNSDDPKQQTYMDQNCNIEEGCFIERPEFDNKVNELFN